MRYGRLVVILVGVGVMLCAGVGEGAWFMPLPLLPPVLPGETLDGGDAFAVSADGSVVVGYSDDGLAYHAVRWTDSGSIEKLGGGSGSFGAACPAMARSSPVIVLLRGIMRDFVGLPTRRPFLSR